MSDIVSLSGIEKEIMLVLTDGKSYWTKCYQLMRIVEKEQLYLEANYKSFTAWLNAFQHKAGVNVRVLWQQKKAGSFYESYKKRTEQKGKVLPDIDDIKITPTNLTYIEKITESHPWLEDKLMKRAIDGEVSRRELKNTWESIKAERVAKGEMVVRETRHDKILINASIEQKLSATKAVLCIQSNFRWLSDRNIIMSGAKYDVYANYELNHEDKKYVWDILVAETITTNCKDLRIHGLIILKEDRILEEEIIQNYGKFVDCLWVIVPDGYDKMELIPTGIGILNMNFEYNKKPIDVIKSATVVTGRCKNVMITDILMRYLKNAKI